jgi:hypothetical protein
MKITQTSAAAAVLLLNGAIAVAQCTWKIYPEREIEKEGGGTTAYVEKTRG